MAIKKYEIEVFEHGFIGIGDDLGDGKKFEEEHLALLKKYYEKQAKRSGNIENTFFDLAYQKKRDGVKFKQYVGVLMVKDLYIYVLPKADKNAQGDSSWRQRLIEMLSQVKDLKLDTMTADKLQKRPHTLFNIFIKKFIDEVAVLLNRGLIKTYRKTEGNRTALKGKLLFNKQIAYNCVHQERFYVKYTTYDYNHILNRILRQALQLIPFITTSSDLKGKAVSMLFNFPELPEIEATPDLFRNLLYDRKSEDYREAIQLAEMILLNFMPDLQHGGAGVWALMFDMNKLWEEFIYVTLQRGLAKDGYEVLPQQKKQFWTGKRTVKIKPDIIITKNGNTFVLDTKWKIPRDEKGRISPSVGDLHQLFAYHKIFNAEKVALLYPSFGEHKKQEGTFIDKSSCDMMFLPKPDDKFKDWQDEIVKRVKTWLKDSSQISSISPLFYKEVCNGC